MVSARFHGDEARLARAHSRGAGVMVVVVGQRLLLGVGVEPLAARLHGLAGARVRCGEGEQPGPRCRTGSRRSASSTPAPGSVRSTAPVSASRPSPTRGVPDGRRSPWARGAAATARCRTTRSTRVRAFLAVRSASRRARAESSAAIESARGSETSAIRALKESRSFLSSLPLCSRSRRAAVARAAVRNSATVAR